MCVWIVRIVASISETVQRYGKAGTYFYRKILRYIPINNKKKGATRKNGLPLNYQQNTTGGLYLFFSICSGK